MQDVCFKCQWGYASWHCATCPSFDWDEELSSFCGSCNNHETEEECGNCFWWNYKYEEPE